MKDRPILFSGPMVRSLCDDRKKQTRRLVNVRPEVPPAPGDKWYRDRTHDAKDGEWSLWRPNVGTVARWTCPYGVPGDLLWVRESWSVGACADGFKPTELHPPTWLRTNGGLWLEGQEPASPISRRGKHRPSMFMPRWASRLTLAITDVRIERLHDISEHDAIEEGVCSFLESTDRPGSWTGLSQDDRNGMVRVVFGSAVKAYQALWESINSAASWDANPWVVAVTFDVYKQNVDEYIAALSRKPLQQELTV